jgi:hypothetical protein
MNPTYKVLTAGAMAVLLGLSACNNDDEKDNGIVAKEKAKTEITSFNNEAAGDLQDLADTEGMDAMEDFFNLVDQDDPFGRIASDKGKARTFFREKGREFRRVFTPASRLNGKALNDEPFDFEENKGVYVWDAQQQIFVLESEANVVEIHFPTEGSETNNAVLTLSEYEEQLIEDEFDYYYEPTRISASLSVDENEAASLEFTVEYDESGFPTTADVELTVTPFSATLTFDESSANQSSVSFSLLKNQTVLAATSIVAKYSDSSKSEESLSTIEGYVQFKNLKLQGVVDYQAANAEEVNWEEVVQLEMYSGSDKIGDVIFATENEEDIAYIRYADGSTEKLEDVMQPVVDELNSLCDSLESEG